MLKIIFPSCPAMIGLCFMTISVIGAENTPTLPAPAQTAPATATEISKAESQSLIKAYTQEATQTAAATDNEALQATEEMKESLQAAVLRQRREQLLSEITYIESKIDWAKKKFVGKASSNSPDEKEIDKWKREVAAWEARLANAKTDLVRLTDETVKLAATEVKTAPLQAPAPATAQGTTPAIETIQPGETLEVFVAEDETLNGLYQVRRGGYIILARVGRIFVTGKTIEEAEDTIKMKLEVDQLRHAAVTVEKALGKDTVAQAEAVIYLAGEFLHPGPWIIGDFLNNNQRRDRIYPTIYTARPTVITSILCSGGVTEYADLEHVKVLRLVNGRPLIEEINVQAILDGNELTSDLTVKANDIIHVPSRSGENKIVYVSGNVVQPGALKMPADEVLTVYSAILRSGGFYRFANLKKVFVLRDQGNGVKSRIPVNLEDVKKGSATDLPLESGDIVIVPEKFFSF